MAKRYFSGRGKFSNKKRVSKSVFKAKYRPKSSKRKGTFKAKKLRQKEKLTLQGLMQPQRYVINYADSINTTGTTNNPAAQIMWGSSQNQSTWGGAALSAAFMCNALFDGQAIQLAMGAAGGIMQAPTGANTGNTVKMLINKYSSRMRLKNVTSGEVELIHYRCRLRKDLGAQNSTASSLAALIANQNAAAPLPATTGVKLPPVSTDYGTRPFDLPSLVKFVHIKSSKCYFLKPNAAISLKVTRRKPKLVNWLDYALPTSASSTQGSPDTDGSTPVGRQALKGATFSLFILRGTVASNSAASAGFRVGVGNADILVQACIEIDYQVVAPNVQTAAMYQGLQGFSTGAGYYPLPLTGVYQVIDTVNTTTGARVPITTNPYTIPQVAMVT